MLQSLRHKQTEPTLTLHGIIKSVSFDLVAEFSDTTIGILGSFDIVFADYGMSNPSNAVVKTGDTGLLEFVLAFARE